MNARKKKFSEMTTQELTEATREFDREFIADTFKPLSPKMRERWERAKRKPGRPRTGDGVQVISVSVEKNLLAESDALAKKLKLTRAGLIARSLKAALIVEGVRS
jgi:hypothetical protein